MGDLLGFSLEKSRQRKSEQDLNLPFTLGYKSNFNASLGAVGSRDFTNNDINGFVGEFFPFGKFKRAFGASNVCDPAEGLKSASTQTFLRYDVIFQNTDAFNLNLNDITGF